MIKEVLEIAKECEQNDELFEVGARIMKKAYDALIKVGFTAEQAMQIIASTGMPGKRK